MASTTSKTPIQLPVIDISNPLDAAVGKQMVSAAVKYGFFYVHGKGSDFSAQEVDQTFELVGHKLGLMIPCTYSV
jgi:isopenicillin N synthase-like dioxygenase